jgi:hypothetical protein
MPCINGRLREDSSPQRAEVGDGEPLRLKDELQQRRVERLSGLQVQMPGGPVHPEKGEGRTRLVHGVKVRLAIQARRLVADLQNPPGGTVPRGHWKEHETARHRVVGGDDSRIAGGVQKDNRVLPEILRATVCPGQIERHPARATFVRRHAGGLYSELGANQPRRSVSGNGIRRKACQPQPGPKEDPHPKWTAGSGLQGIHRGSESVGTTEPQVNERDDAWEDEETQGPLAGLDSHVAS